MAIKFKGRYELLAAALKVDMSRLTHIADISTRGLVMLKFTQPGYGNRWAAFSHDPATGDPVLVDYGPKAFDHPDVHKRVMVYL